MILERLVSYGLNFPDETWAIVDKAVMPSRLHGEIQDLLGKS